jgi:hypothetical protein
MNDIGKKHIEDLQSRSEKLSAIEKTGLETLEAKNKGATAA